MEEARKLTFQEVWESATIFFVDEKLENEIDETVRELLETAERLPHREERTRLDTISLLASTSSALDVILKDVGLSEEKFKRIISLLRKIGRISGNFDSEWSMTKIKSKLSADRTFLQLLAELLLDGKRDSELADYIPRYYLDKLNYREIGTLSPAARKVRYKDALIGTYGAKKGHRVEEVIAAKLQAIEAQYGIGYEKGRSRLINVDIDFAIPTLDNPWVIIMSTFQETTSSGQTTKARDMLNAYTAINISNSRNVENRAFVNFVDGGGWLARKRDLQRLVKECHYFINLQHLDMLESIVLQHVPH